MTGSCRSHSLTLSMLLCMHAAASWRLRGQGGQKRAWKRSGLPHGPPHTITIYFLESVRGGQAISSPSHVYLFSADARRAIRFQLSTVYSIAVPHVSEIARQCVSPPGDHGWSGADRRKGPKENECGSVAMAGSWGSS